METETLEVNGMKYPVRIHSEKRGNCAVSIGKKGISIRIPLSLNMEERFRRLMKLKQWARDKLEENPQKFKPDVQREYKDGDILKVGDEEYNLRIEFRDNDGSSARIAGNDGNEVHMSISSGLSPEMQNSHISTMLSRCISAKRIPKLKEKISELNRLHFNQPLNKIFFKHNKSNWGSCSGRGNINISTRLLFAPEDVLEYVCVHELAHLIEHGHSERFWALVGKAMPEYEEKINWLKENGNKCRF